MIFLRIVKCVIVGSVGLFTCLVAYNNLVDYDSNWVFIRHVLAMDTVFPDNRVRARAITDPLLQTAAYWSIIAVEWASGLLCLFGAWRLWRARGDRRAFIAAKAIPAAGLLLAWLLYFVGMLTIGGEWFTMWQSSRWNGQPDAARFLTSSTLALILLLIPESDDAPA